MTKATPSNSRFGLKWLFVVVGVAAILVRAGIWVDESRNPRTDLVGKVVFKEGEKPGPNIKVWAHQAYRDLTLLGIREPDPAQPTPPSYAERTEYVTTNKHGEFRFRNLKRGSHYTLGIEDDDWVAPIVELDADSRKHVIPPLRATEGALISVRVVDLNPDSPPLPTLCVREMGPSVFERHSTRDQVLSARGTAQLRVTPGLRSVWLEGTPFVQFPLGKTVQPTQFSDGQLKKFNVAFERQSGVMTRIVHNEANGHFYVAVPHTGAWHTAKQFANSCQLETLGGHLLTISSNEEHEFLKEQFGNLQTWTAGTDFRRNGTWQWDDGPEEGRVFYRADKPHLGFHRWADGEPDELLVDHYMFWECTKEGASWRDAYSSYEMAYLIVEFSPEE